MNYEQAIDFIHGTLKFGSKLGLENIRTLLKLMGNPHEKLKYIHVAGTNGKGSTTAIISNILKEAGYRTGMFTSPYIEEFTERIQVNGEKIDKKRLAEITSRVKELINQMVKQGSNHPTEFEVVTAIAFQYYYEKKCDFVVLEVGMGGRLDATNVIDTPLLSVITAIDMDHMQYLGNTLAEIAYEKCGIIKKNGLLVTYSKQHLEALKVINEVSKKQSAKVIKADDSLLEVMEHTLEGMKFNFATHKDLQLHLLGEHQLLNAVTALTSIDALRDYYNVMIQEEHIKNGLKGVYWPGRFEMLGKNPYIIVDGAHNLAGIYALERNLKIYCEGKKLTLVIGMLKDKDYGACIEQIAKVADCIIATTVPYNTRAASAEEIARVSRKYCDSVFVESDLKEAVKLAFCKTEQEDIICFCGSLYMVADIKKYVADI